MPRRKSSGKKKKDEDKQIDYSGTYEVRKVLDCRGKGTKKEYLLQWKDSWLEQNEIVSFH